MSYPVYTVYSGDVLPIFFDSFDGGTGASITMTGLAVTDIEIYKDGSATQRASDAGYTLLDTDGIDFDGITGIHGFSIDTGDNTDAGFYAVGSWYHVVVSSITIDGQTVNFVAAAFRIMAAEAVAGVPVVDIKAISGDATAADNLEDFYEETTAIGNLIDMFDGTGYVGGTIKLASDATLNATQGSYAPAKAGDSMALTAAAVDTIWDEVASGHSTAGSFGKYLDSDISANTDHITADYGSTEKSAIDLLDDAYSGTLHAAIADAVWEEAKSGHTTASTFGDLGAEAFTLADDAITSAKFDESTAFPIKSADTGATIIARPGDKMDIVDAPSSIGVLAIVDAFLTRAFGSVTYTGTTRCVLTALQKLRNKVANSGGTQTVYKENDSTASYTSTITTDAAADPVVSIDPDS